MANDESLCSANSEYYRACLSVILDRQVGSRYFVTAANSSKILFLRKAAIDFLEYTFRHIRGNKLEKSVYAKLSSSEEIVHLKLDALLFCQVYADLVSLAKSKQLKKSVLDMNTHYLELQTFLKQLQHNPKMIMDCDLRVF